MRPAAKHESRRTSSAQSSSQNTSYRSAQPSEPEPEKRRRRKVRKKFVSGPGELALRFGAVGAVLDKINGVTARWLGAQLKPMFVGNMMTRITAIGTWAYFLGVVVTWIMLKFWSDESVAASLVAYGPRFVALWPLAALAPLALIFVRRALWPQLIAAVIVIMPIMGFRVSPSTISSKLPPAPAAGTLRLLTFNTLGGRSLAFDVPIVLKEMAPDVFTFQECGNELWAAIEAQKDWYSKRFGSLCTGSRWPIQSAVVMPREDIARISERGLGGAGLVMATTIESPQGRLVVVNVHLETARRGLEGMFGDDGVIPDDNPFNRAADSLNGIVQPEQPQFSADARFRRNVLIRDTESERASKWSLAMATTENAPLLIAGDFNLPVESTIFQDHWSQFVDAFEAKGNGLGWTKREGRWLRIRIDHILSMKGGFEPRIIEVQPDLRSDHLPVMADYAWPKTAKP